MGMGHMKQVWALWAELPDRPFRVLLYIAMRLPDAEASPRWYGSPDELAVAIGDAAIVDGPRRKTVLNKVSSAVTVLVDAGALVVVQRGSPGRRAVYELQTSMERSRYSRDRSTDGRRWNSPENSGTTVPETSGTFAAPHCLTGLGLREDKDLGVVLGVTVTSPARLRAIDGGRDDRPPDPVQLPFLAAVPNPPPEPATHQPIEGAS